MSKFNDSMEISQMLREVSKQVFENVKDMAGTEKAAGDFGMGAGGDISRNIDVTAENTVINYFKGKKFECVILGEECGRVELSPNPQGYIIMDAVDGSANAIRGIPFFCCSLAFATEDKLSSITDSAITNLSTGEIFWASKGKGAFLDDKPISVQKEKPLYKIVGINTSGASSEQLKKLEPIFQKHNHTRHFGANALEMAMFAQGLMDIYIDFRGKIRIQDMAAGYLLVKEAGGLMLDQNLQSLESDLSYETRLSFVAAANNEILDQVLPK